MIAEPVMKSEMPKPRMQAVRKLVLVGPIIVRF